MPVGTNHINPGNPGIEDFIPEAWSDAIIAIRDAKTVMKGLTYHVPHGANKGDVINIPMEGPGNAAVEKQFQTAVTLQNHDSDTFRLTVDKHLHYAYLIEDKEGAQSLSALKPMLSKAAGRNLARTMDARIFAYASTAFQGGTPFTAAVDPYDPAGWPAAYHTALTRAVIGSDGETLYTPGSPNAASLSDAAVLNMILRLENNDVDPDELVFVLPPSAKRDILSLDKHTLVNQKGRPDELLRGQFGDIYGVPVVLTNACPKVPDGSGGFNRVGMLMSKSAIYFALQWDIRTQVDYQLDYLGTLFVADCLYGLGIPRTNEGIAVVVPNQ